MWIHFFSFVYRATRSHAQNLLKLRSGCLIKYESSLCNDENKNDCQPSQTWLNHSSKNIFLLRFFMSSISIGAERVSGTDRHEIVSWFAAVKQHQENIALVYKLQFWPAMKILIYSFCHLTEKVKFKSDNKPLRHKIRTEIWHNRKLQMKTSRESGHGETFSSFLTTTGTIWMFKN